MEKIQSVLEKDEAILWSGHPINGALKEEYINARISWSLYLSIFTGALVGLVLSSAWENSEIFLLIVTIGLDIFFITRLIQQFKERKLNELFYAISSKRIYVNSPHRFKGKNLSVEDAEFSAWEFNPEKKVASIALEKMDEVQIRPNVGVRKWIGIKGYNVRLTFKNIGLKNMYYRFPQISEAPELVNLITQRLSFQRIPDELEAETYISENYWKSYNKHEVKTIIKEISKAFPGLKDLADKICKLCIMQVQTLNLPANTVEKALNIFIDIMRGKFANKFANKYTIEALYSYEDLIASSIFAVAKIQELPCTPEDVSKVTQVPVETLTKVYQLFIIS